MRRAAPWPRAWPLRSMNAKPARRDSCWRSLGLGRWRRRQRKSWALRLAIRAGRLVDAACERKDLQREFWEYCHTDENSDRVGELAFGTNLGLTEMIGVLLQDEKFPGVHLAFGDPYGSQTHADWKSTTHVDVLTRKCDVWIDDQQVIEKGRYQLAYLGLS